MARDDAGVGGAEGARRLHVLEAAHDEHLTAHQASHPRPADDANHHEHHGERGLHGSGDGDQEQEGREGEGHIGDAHNESLNPSAVVAGDEPERDAEGHGDALTDEPHRQRQSGAVEHAREDVASLRVAPQQKRAGGGVQALGEAAAERIARRDEGRANSQGGESDDDREAEAGPGVTGESGPDEWRGHGGPDYVTRTFTLRASGQAT